MDLPDPKTSGPASEGDRRPPDFEIKAGLLARNTILNLIGLGLPMVIGVLAIPFTIRLLGTERFGLLSLVWVVVGYLAFFDLGLGRATTKFIAEALGRGESERVSRILWTTVFFQVLLGLSGALLLALATPWLTGRVLHIAPRLMAEARVSFILIGVSLPVVLASSSFRGALEARQRFDLVNIVRATSSTLNYVLPLVGVAIGFDLRGIVILLVGARIIVMASWLTLCLRTYPALRKKMTVRRENVPVLLKFGGWITVSNVVMPVLNYLDRFLVGSLLNMRAVGFYVAPYEMVTKVGILQGSLVMTLFPSFSHFQGRADHERSRTLFGYAFKYLIIGIGPVSLLLIFLAHPILRLYLGAEFARTSAKVFQFMAAGLLASALADVALAFIQGIGRPDLTAKVHALEFLLFVPLGYLFIKTWGITGAAAAWAFRVTFDMTVLHALAWRVGGMRFTGRELFQKRIPQGVLALALFGLAGAVLQRITGNLIGLAAPLAGYLALCLLFVLNKREISWLRDGLNRILAGPERRKAGA
jgi:O-antigen/teichoic acid export membrane protein